MPRISEGHLDLPHNERCAASCEWLADIIESASVTSSPPIDDSNGEGKPADSYRELRRYAREELKGQERSVIEELCNSNGVLPIADLALKPGVGWNDPEQGFKDVQRRLNPKLKKQKWRLFRRNNAANLATLKRR
jgi:hypothetical protein